MNVRRPRPFLAGATVAFKCQECGQATEEPWLTFDRRSVCLRCFMGRTDPRDLTPSSGFRRTACS